jgi:FtsP/CotA-like multicopper oxidase with cupredoxin domain
MLPAVVLGLLVQASGGGPPPTVIPRLPDIRANDNRVAAGVLRGSTLTLRLVATEGRWYPDLDQSPPVVVQAFAVEGHTPSNPGPMIRVREGTHLVVSVRNALSRRLVLHGFHTRPSTLSDTVEVAAGAVREIRFDAGVPGTYYYWGATMGADSIPDRGDRDSQLHGAFIVDPAGGPAPHDHVFVISGMYLPPDSAGRITGDGRFEAVINGRAWPHTERLTYTVGDTVRWRIINASFETHPMHLHGFFFRVTARGGEGADTLFRGDERPEEVTHPIESGATVDLSFLPHTPGHWLFHCHLQPHVTTANRYPFPGAHGVPHPTGNHAQDMMWGLVLGIDVRPRLGAAHPVPPAPARAIRMVIAAVHGTGTNSYGVRFSGTAFDGPADAPHAAAPLVLVRGELARITIVNALAGPTAIHWHGIELLSYYDGVPGWSGLGSRTAPLIAPGDSFTVEMAPPRAGTFIYHTHMEENTQRGDGLYGPLIVLEPGEAFDSERDRTLILGGRELGDHDAPTINGDSVMPPMTLVAGRTYRMRIVNMMEVNSPTLSLLEGERPARWRLVAKDAGAVPPSQEAPRDAVIRAAVGETYDFLFAPAAPGMLRFELRRGSGRLVGSAPVTVR